MNAEDAILNHVLLILKHVAERGDTLLNEIEMLSHVSERNVSLRMALYRQCTKILSELTATLRIHLMAITDRALRNDISRMVGVLSDEAQEVLDNPDATNFLHGTLWHRQSSQKGEPYRIEQIIHHIESWIESKRRCPDCDKVMKLQGEQVYVCEECGKTFDVIACPHCKRIFRTS